MLVSLTHGSLITRCNAKLSLPESSLFVDDGDVVLESTLAERFIAVFADDECFPFVV